METQDLVRQAQQGSETARRALFERYERRVLALVRRRMGRHLRRLDDSMDIAQSVLLDALEDLEHLELRSEDAFARWIAGITVNKLRNRARRTGRPLELLPETEGPVEESPTPCPAAHALEAERAERLHAALETLAPELRDVLLLRQLHDLPWAEIATRLGVCENTALRRYARACERLQRALGP